MIYIGMDTNEAARIARLLMREHGLGHWTFQFDRAEKRFGICKHGPNVIQLSEPLTRINDEATVRDTVLHEIAHALVGRGHGHDYTWRRKCIEVGARPERCYDGDEVNGVPPRWIGRCPGCGMETRRNRLTEKARNRIACAKCCGRTFDPRFRFVWRSN